MKKLITLKVELADIRAMDAKAKAWGMNRSAMILMAVESLPDNPDAQKPLKPASTAPKPRPRKEIVPAPNWPSTIPASGGVARLTTPFIVGEKPSEQTIKKRVPRQPNEVRVSDIAVAGWKENRPAPGSMLKQPKKAK